MLGTNRAGSLLDGLPRLDGLGGAWLRFVALGTIRWDVVSRGVLVLEGSVRLGRGDIWDRGCGLGCIRRGLRRSSAVWGRARGMGNFAWFLVTMVTKGRIIARGQRETEGSLTRAGRGSAGYLLAVEEGDASLAKGRQSVTTNTGRGTVCPEETYQIRVTPLVDTVTE